MAQNKTANVIRAAALIALLTLSFSSSISVSAADPASVSVIAPAKVNQGQTFVVSIAVTPGSAIAGMQFDLSFDASLITAVSVQEGNLLSQGGASTYFSSGTIGAGVISGVNGVIITPGQSVSTAGTFATVTFTANTTGGSCALTLSNVIVGDINGQSLPVNVTDGQVGINRPPVLSPVGNRSVNEGQLIQFTISATDPDSDPLTYSASSLPVGATFNPATRTFSWTPNYAQAGTYSSIIFAATDGYLTTQETITITVNQPYPDWDVNGDGKTNVLDMIRIGQHWGETGTIGWIQEDVNHNGSVNVLDMILIGQHWTG